MSVPIYERTAEILQTLIRFDTTNPPGNEAACIADIDGLLTEAGLQTTLLAKDPQRPNLVARLKGSGDAPPGPARPCGRGDHRQPEVDAPALRRQGDRRLAVGRGALDMKGDVTMMLAAVLRAKAEGLVPAGDIILTIMADEEAGSDYGARFLTEQHPEQFEGAAYAIGEGGGSSQTIFGQRYYLIAVAEKQVCWMRAALNGPGGHGSTPLRGGAMAKLGRLLSTLDANRLPVHITPVAERMIAALAEAAPAPQAELLRLLLDPERTDAALDELAALGVPQARMLDALLHNTANVTVAAAATRPTSSPAAPTWRSTAVAARLHARRF